MKEIWKDIPNYEGLYQASNLGRIKSLKRNKILNQIKSSDTYLQVFLCKNNKVKGYQVHRLIAKTFLNKKNFKYYDIEDKNNADIEKLQVNHKDENKQNNFVDNLEWCTHKYNINYGTNLQRAILKKIKSVLQFDKNGNFIKEWSTMTEAKKHFNCKNNEITDCCKGRRETYKNYVWKYKN